jgi:hypothetical protein
MGPTVSSIPVLLPGAPVPKRIVTLTVGVVAVPLLGVAAYAAAMAVSDRPDPEVVVPPVRTITHSMRHVGRTGSTTTTSGDDHGADGAGHDVGDDAAAGDDHRGPDPGPSSTTIADRSSGGPGPNQGPGPTSTTSTTVDDHHGGSSHGGSDASGSGPGDGGGDTRGP